MMCFFFILISCNSKTKITSAQKASTSIVDYFADNGFGNAVAVVQHPSGIYHNGVTYVCFQGPLEDPYVASYNHETKEWKGPYKAGISEMGKDPKRKKRIDNHGKPSIIIDDAEYIHITFGGHGGMRKHGENTLGNHHYGKNLHAVSQKPLDISSWEMLDNIPPFGTYNQFIKMDNGDIYLFYRHGAHRSNWVYQKSTDNVDLNPHGNPHVCIRIGADIGRDRSAPKSLHHFRWNGDVWVQSKNSQLPEGGGDIEVISTNRVNIYLDDTRAGEVSRWASFDAGDTFKKGLILIKRNNSGFAISSLIDNAHPDARIIVAEKESGKHFRKMYLLGDNGPIQRDKNQADVLEDRLLNTKN